MAFIDSQAHATEANTAKQPGHTLPDWPSDVKGDQKVAALGQGSS